MNSAIIDLINTQWVEEEEEEEGENNTNKERQAGKKRENTEKKNLHIQFQKKLITQMKFCTMLFHCFSHLSCEIGKN